MKNTMMKVTMNANSNMNAYSDMLRIMSFVLEADDAVLTANGELVVFVDEKENGYTSWTFDGFNVTRRYEHPVYGPCTPVDESELWFTL